MAAFRCDLEGQLAIATSQALMLINLQRCSRGLWQVNRKRAAVALLPAKWLDTLICGTRCNPSTTVQRCLRRAWPRLMSVVWGNRNGSFPRIIDAQCLIAYNLWLIQMITGPWRWWRWGAAGTYALREVGDLQITMPPLAIRIFL